MLNVRCVSDVAEDTGKIVRDLGNIIREVKNFIPDLSDDAGKSENLKEMKDLVKNRLAAWIFRQYCGLATG